MAQSQKAYDPNGFEGDARGAYQQVRQQADRNASKVAELQRIARFFLESWDNDSKMFDHKVMTARNGLRSLVKVPLTERNVTHHLEEALRDAFRSALVEEAQEDKSRPNSDNDYTEEAAKQWDSNKRVRAIFQDAIAIGNDGTSVAKIKQTIKDLEAESNRSQ